jgi:hypothetical protein
MDLESKKAITDLTKFFASEQGIESTRSKEYRELRSEVKYEVENARSSYGDGIEIDVEGTEYLIYADVDDAESAAVESVKDMMENDPESFGSFLSSYLQISPTDQRIIAQEEADSRYEDADRSDLQREYEYNEYELRDKVELDEDGEIVDLEEAREALSELAYKEIHSELDDPVQYFVHDHGMYSLDDLAKASFISIDYDEAAQDAVNADGFSHFLNSWDGDYSTTDLGIVVMRNS